MVYRNFKNLTRSLISLNREKDDDKNVVPSDSDKENYDQYSFPIGLILSEWRYVYYAKNKDAARSVFSALLNKSKGKGLKCFMICRVA